MANVWGTSEEYDQINALAAHLWKSYCDRIGAPRNQQAPFDSLDNQTMTIFRGHAKAALEFLKP